MFAAGSRPTGDASGCLLAVPLRELRARFNVQLLDRPVSPGDPTLLLK
jgi:hypothetical protein